MTSLARRRVSPAPRTSRSALVWVACLTAALSCEGRPRGGATPEPDASTAASSSYLGQPVPGDTAERFAPGLVSTDAIELNSVFTPDGREFFFTRMVDGVHTIHRSVLMDVTWSEPRPLVLFPGGEPAMAVDMGISADGGELWFVGRHTSEYAPRDPSNDLWRSRRVDGSWSTAEVVPPPISTPASELYPVLVGDGSVWFTSNRPGAAGPSRLYRAQRLPDGSLADPVDVGAPINSEHGTGDTFVAPDESWMVFSSSRPGGHGGGDLWVSFRTAEGGWSEPANLGAAVNTDAHEYCPMATPDGKFLFFSRRVGASWAETTAGDVYWIDARVLDAFRHGPRETALPR